MDADELVSRLYALLGVEVPKGTIRRWASEGLISQPESEGRKGKQGRFMSWPPETVEQAAAVYIVRHTDTAAKTTTKTIFAVKEVVDRYYAIINECIETEDPAALKKFDALLKPVTLPDGMRGYMYGDREVHRLVIRWIATLEKIRHNKPLFEHMEVVFNWTTHFVQDEGGTESLKLRYDGIIFEHSDQDKITRRYSRMRPSDREEAEQHTIISFNSETDWDNVQFDVKNQQIIIRDPQKKDVTVIDLKKSGMHILSDQEWTEIERKADK